MMDRANDWLRASARVQQLRARTSAAMAELDPVALVVASWWLALVAITVLHQAHAGLHEHNELPPLLHLIRDVALAVPSAALAIVMAAIALGPRLQRGEPGVRNGLKQLDRFLWVVLGAAIFGVLAVPGNQVHSVLFGAATEELGWLADASLDAVIAFIGGLIALLPVAIVVGPPIRRAPGLTPATAPLVADPDRSTDVMARSTR
jgi:hypothetical protein